MTAPRRHRPNPRQFTRAGKSARRVELADWEPTITEFVAAKIGRYPSTCSIRAVWPSDIALIVSHVLDAVAVSLDDGVVAK